MTRVEMGEAKGSLADYVRAARKETVVVTLHGKPVATVTAVPKGADWESLAVSRHPKFLKIMARSKRRHEKEGGLSSDELRAQFGIKAKTPRKPRRRTR